MNGLADLNTAFGLDSPDPAWLEAATGKPARRNKARRDRYTEPFVPAPPSSDPDRPAQRPAPATEPLQGSPPSQGGGRLDAQEPGFERGGEMFPFPGDTSEPEEWARAFTLEGSHTAPAAPTFSGIARTQGQVSVNGQPTLWRSVPIPSSSLSASASASASVDLSRDSIQEIHQRLDKLTKQLEELGSGLGTIPGSWMPSSIESNNADLFLFIAIGLLFLLALDTLLRFATSHSLQVPVRQMGGGRGQGQGQGQGWKRTMGRARTLGTGSGSGSGRWRTPRLRSVFV